MRVSLIKIRVIHNRYHRVSHIWDFIYGYLPLVLAYAISKQIINGLYGKFGERTINENNSPIS